MAGGAGGVPEGSGVMEGGGGSVSNLVWGEQWFEVVRLHYWACGDRIRALVWNLYLHRLGH
jgi:hypothetical protein